MSEALDREREERRTGEGEHRLPPAAAILVAAVVYALLPESALVGPRFATPGIELLLLAALVATNPLRMNRHTVWSRRISVVLAAIVIVTNLIALALLLDQLSAKSTHGTAMLIAAMQVWLTNVIGFALLFWELDRGGPVARRTLRRKDLPPADWRFSQDENKDTVSEVSVTASSNSGWVPTFVDYLYVSVTNSSAFSPTDTMPLSSRAKLLMGLEATAALVISLLVVAHAVGAIGTG